VTVEWFLYALLLFVGTVLWTGVATVRRLDRIIALLERDSQHKPVEKPE
jgi:hypothetical protein